MAWIWGFVWLFYLEKKKVLWLCGGGDEKHRLRSMILGLSSESPRELFKNINIQHAPQSSEISISRTLCACVHAKLLPSHLTLCNPMNCSPPGSSVHGILQARPLEWVAMPSSRGSSWPRDRTHISYISCIGWWILYHYCHLGIEVIMVPNMCWVLTVSNIELSTLYAFLF